MAVAHPNVVPLLVTRPLATPLALRPRGTLRLLEDLLELLIDAGFGPDGALHAYRLYFGFLQSHIFDLSHPLSPPMTARGNWTRDSTSSSADCTADWPPRPETSS
ncbi:hypothetical protein ACVGVM_20640 [Pseudonocardia bannensis]